MSSTGGSAIRPYELLHARAEVMGRPFVEVAEEYAMLLRPMPTALEGKITYFESSASLMGELATAYEGSPVFESKGNQRKLLILRYFSKKRSATSLEVTRDLDMSLTNASERLRRYYKQGLLARRALVKGKRGRPTIIYELTKAGQRRLAFLEENVKSRRTETDKSEKYRLRKTIVELHVRALRKWGASP